MKKLLLLLALMLSMAAAKTQVSTLEYYYPGISPLCGCPYQDWCVNDINCGLGGWDCKFNPSVLEFRGTYSGPTPGGTIGTNPYRFTMELFFNGNVINSVQDQRTSAYFMFTFSNTPVTSGQYRIKVLFQKRTIAGWVNVNNTWSNIINVNLCPICPSNVTVSGTPLFTTPLTESDTWIQTSGSTIIPAGASVTFDAEPGVGYISLNPGFETQNGAVFVGHLLDGCPFVIFHKQVPVADAPAIVTKAELKIYPNPTGGLVTVRHPVGLALLQVYDVAGALRLAVKASVAGTTELNISHLPAGIYYVRAQGQPPQKLVKQ